MTTKKAATKKAAATDKDETRLVFPDPGLHIAVLGALMEAEAIDSERIEAKLEGIEGDDETDRLRAAMARLHSIKLDRKKVARLDRLDFDGGNEIYMMMESGADVYTGGEDDTYSLRSLAGIGALEALETLDLDGHGFFDDLRDLRPLEGLAKLTHLTLTGDWTHAASLETLPKLASLDVRLGSVDDPAALDRLAARGVEVLR